MNARRTLPALAIGLALCMAVVLARTSHSGDDAAAQEAASEAPRAPTAKSAATNPVRQSGTSNDAYVAGLLPAEPERLLAMGTGDATRMNFDGLPLPEDPTGDAAQSAGSIGGGSSASGFPGSGNGAAGAASGSGSTGNRGAAAAGNGGGAGPARAGRPSSTPATAPTAATPAAGATQPSDASIVPIAAVAPDDVAPHDEGHRRGVRSLNVVDSGTSHALQVQVPPVPLQDGGIGTDGDSTSPVASNQVLPMQETTDDGNPQIAPFPFIANDPPAVDPALVETAPETTRAAVVESAIPEPGTMTLLFLGLLALNVTRSVAMKRSGPFLRILSMRGKPAGGQETSALTQST